MTSRFRAAKGSPFPSERVIGPQSELSVMIRFRIRQSFSVRAIKAIGSAMMLALLPGCFGVTSNPARIGNLPSGDIIRTHAKPPLRGYYHDFDPKARQLTVTPLECVNQVGSQHVIIATVCDDDGNGRRNRRVEWHVTGKGHIVEVDESGLFPGRGYLVDDKYAVSYTNYRAHTITRGNDDPSDDIHLKPGQTWCVITSAEEGDTHVTCYAPGIYNWEKHKIFAVKHWVDAEACFPPPAVNPVGQPHPLTTRVTRHSDRTGARGYRVRYRIIDGPPAVLEPGGAAQVEVVSDMNGNAGVILRQLQPIPGINRISIEVVRPADTPTGKEVRIACAETTKTWVSPQLVIQKNAPSVAAVGQQIPYQIIVTNTGTIASQGGIIRDTLPDTLQFIGAHPMASRQGPNLLWNFGPLQPGQSVAVQFGCVATVPGTVTNCAEVNAEGSARSCATTQILAGALEVQKIGPATASVGQPLTFQINVTNRGNGPASNVVVVDSFDPGFTHETGAAPVQLPLGVIAPGETRSVPIVLIPKVPGRLCNHVSATADGGLAASADHCVEVTQPTMEITKTGPKFAIVGAPVDFEILVRNAGSTLATSVIVRDQSPAQLVPQQLSEGGVLQGQMASWNLGSLQPGEARTLRIRALASGMGDNVCNVATLSADGLAPLQAPACLQIRGIPALLTELIDRFDPVPVGSETTYTIQITNQGSVPANEIALTCKVPEGIEYVDAECFADRPGSPTSARYDSATRTLVFPTFPSMEPRKRLLYQVQVRGTRPGDVRFEARVSARELKEPVVMQQSTQIYDPNTGATNGGASTNTPETENLADAVTPKGEGETRESPADQPAVVVPASDKEKEDPPAESARGGDVSSDIPATTSRSQEISQPTTDSKVPFEDELVPMESAQEPKTTSSMKIDLSTAGLLKEDSFEATTLELPELPPE